MERNPRKTKWAILLVIFGVAFGICENYLAKQNLNPGWIYATPYFDVKDSLVDYKGFFVDNHGIQKVSPFSERMIAERLKGYPRPRVREMEVVQRNGIGWEPFCIFEDHLEFIQNDSGMALKGIVDSLHQVHPDSLSCFGKSVLRYLAHPINQDGFRSITFRNYPDSRGTILLLGDSFGFGHSADNFLNSYADILLGNGYGLLNSSITATDPAQYQKCAEVFIPRYQPEYVVMNVFLGNDIVYFLREPSPEIPVFYPTNAGHIMSNPEGYQFKSRDEAYQNILDTYRIPVENGSWFNWLCSQTRCTSMFWRLLWRNGFIPERWLSRKADAYFKAKTENLFPYPVTLDHIRNVRDLCREKGIHFLLMITPDVHSFHTPPEEMLPGLDEFEYRMPTGLEISDYKADEHYTDEGHAKHAREILSWLKEWED